MLVIQRPTVEALGEAEGDRQRFAIGPLEPGFGHTLGNSLRRTLLSSIPGAAVTQVRFDDALHEFDTIAGVSEDVTDIILNIKDLVIRCHADDPITLRLDVRGPADVTAASLQRHSDIEILNASLAPPFQLDEENLSETVRLTHRVIDLRRETMQKNLRLRYRVAMAVRKYLDARGAVDRLRSPHSRYRDRRVDHAPRRAGVGRRDVAGARPTRRRDERPAARPRAGRGRRRRVGFARSRFADRGSRAVRAAAQLPQASADQHRRRVVAEDRR